MELAEVSSDDLFSLGVTIDAYQNDHKSHFMLSICDQMAR